MVPSTVRSVSAAFGPARLLTWSSDDGRRLETVRIVITERGLRASGYLVVVGRHSFGASYSVLCDAAGRTRRLTVQSDSVAHRAWPVADPHTGRTVAGRRRQVPPPCPDLDLALDIDLTASAFSNSLAIRRLGLHRRFGEESRDRGRGRCAGSRASAPVVHRYRTPRGDRRRRQDHTITGPPVITRSPSTPQGFVIDLPHLSYRLR